MDQDLYETRKMVMKLRGCLHRSRGHLERVQATSHKYKMKYKSEVNGWKAQIEVCCELLREALMKLLARGNLRRRIIQHLARMPKADSEAKP